MAGTIDMHRDGLLQKPFVRIPLKIGVALIVLVVGLFAVAAIYNSFDEELSAEAKALLAPPQMGGIDERNGYVAMLGMRAPMGEDQMAWGRKVAEALAAQVAPGFTRTPEWKSLLEPRLGATKGAAWCRPTESDCRRTRRRAGCRAERGNAATLPESPRASRFHGSLYRHGSPGSIVRVRLDFL